VLNTFAGLLKAALSFLREAGVSFNTTATTTATTAAAAAATSASTTGTTPAAVSTEDVPERAEE
jgi:hypothetical protein